jgi:hypothetical protein
MPCRSSNPTPGTVRTAPPLGRLNLALWITSRSSTLLVADLRHRAERSLIKDCQAIRRRSSLSGTPTSSSLGDARAEGEFLIEGDDSTGPPLTLLSTGND